MVRVILVLTFNKQCLIFIESNLDLGMKKNYRGRGD